MYICTLWITVMMQAASWWPVWEWQTFFTLIHAGEGNGFSNRNGKRAVKSFPCCLLQTKYISVACILYDSFECHSFSHSHLLHRVSIIPFIRIMLNRLRWPLDYVFLLMIICLNFQTPSTLSRDLISILR